MPSFNTEVSHTLGREQAIERLKAFMNKVRNRDDVSDLQESWRGNVQTFSFRTYGFTIDGTATVEDDRVLMDAKLPLAAAPFRGRIESNIRDELAKALQA